MFANFCKITQDVLEFADMSCNGYLSNLSLTIVSYEEIFLQRFNHAIDENVIRETLKNFVELRMKEFFERLILRFQLEKNTTKNTLLFVRALDRFYRRVQGLNKLHANNEFTIKAMEIVEKATEDQCVHFLEDLKSKFLDELTNIRHLIITATTTGTLASKVPIKSDDKHTLSDLLITLQTKVSELIKSTIASLTSFIECDVTFAKAHFQHKFCTYFVREGIFINFFKFIIQTSANYENTHLLSASPPSQLILLLSRFCLDMETSLISYLLSFIDEQLINVDVSKNTSVSELCSKTKEAAQKLLNHYVRLEGQNISQMIRKSVETRDWLSSVEPRTVRSVMKRVIEDISMIDLQVSQLYEEGTRFERSSDSSRSRRTFYGIGAQGVRPNKTSNWSNYGSRYSFNYYWNVNNLIILYFSNIDSNLMTNIQKLFSEKIEIFGSVEFSYFSVVTSIIKI